MKPYQLKDALLVIGAVIIKHKLSLSDEETVDQIQENPYLQYFVGSPGYQAEVAFAPSLFVESRKRMGQAMFDSFHGAIIECWKRKSLRRLRANWTTCRGKCRKQSEGMMKQQAE